MTLSGPSAQLSATATPSSPPAEGFGAGDALPALQVTQACLCSSTSVLTLSHPECKSATCCFKSAFLHTMPSQANSKHPAMRPAGLSRTFEGIRGFVQTHPDTLTLSQGLDSSRRGVREVVRAGGGGGRWRYIRRGRGRDLILTSILLLLFPPLFSFNGNKRALVSDPTHKEAYSLSSRQKGSFEFTYIFKAWHIQSSDAPKTGQ